MFKIIHRPQALFAGIISLFFSMASFANPVPALKTIEITQIVSHPSLDKVRQGLMDELAKNGYQQGQKAHIVFENAQGSIVVATQIAQQYVISHPDVIVAIATPSAQAVANLIKHTPIPLVFATISDPVQAKLVTNLQHPGGNITGTRNVSPMGKQLALVKQILPQTKTIGIVLNYGEVNSVDLLKVVTTESKKLKIEVKTAAAASSVDVQSATASLIGKVDAVFLLQDNTVASALPALIKVTNDHKIPVFSTYVDAVKEGALAGLAFDEYAIGQQTGKIVVKILNGTKAGNIPVEDPTRMELMFNLDVANNLQIKINDDLIKKANHIYQKTQVSYESKESIK